MGEEGLGRTAYVALSRYGFLVSEDGTEAFLHYSNLDMEGYRAVEPGQTVQFEMRESDKGAQAFHVRAFELPA